MSDGQHWHGACGANLLGIALILLSGCQGGIGENGEPGSCGDSVCGNDEDCNTCVVDCGECPPGSCDGVTCGDNAGCVGGSCQCLPDYEGDPDTGCTPIAGGPCDGVTCGTHATCVAGSCQCLPDYEGDPDVGCTPLPVNPVADWSLPDVNPNSVTHTQLVSPRDYLGYVTAVFYGGFT